MRGGHNLKPAEVRRREGNPGKRPIPEPAVIGYRGAPRMPTDLWPEAQAVWRQIVPELEADGVVRSVDVFALEAFCTQVALMRIAAKQVLDAALLVKGSKGQEVRHPLITILTQAQDEVRKWCDRFGLDPAARTRLGLAAVKGRTLEEELRRTLGA